MRVAAVFGVRWRRRLVLMLVLVLVSKTRRVWNVCVRLYFAKAIITTLTICRMLVLLVDGGLFLSMFLCIFVPGVLCGSLGVLILWVS